ncbi:Acylphosphatase [Symmachiella macrocystis]|uniref:acylphosphatase n=1 Tax=Symmachiella macrocystis TaxID=2527985 RepID=A0A5C6BJT9_9PLAN|nr:acylphosphatase [Symmachiella macrocystis]TWU12022.1 Acylphosphatase [Symmachiella macrocystis]
MSEDAEAQPPYAERVIFRGQVQGVGFRYRTRRLARVYPVTGYVKNLADGTVELIAQGAEDEVITFVDELGRVMERNISAVDRSPWDGSERFAGFSIRR